MRFVNARIVSLLILLVLLADLFYSFLQHYQGTLDGDMAFIILPSPPWAQVLKDPLAWHALVDKAVYAGTNRFMPHWCLERFYKTMPFLLQHFVSPVDSIYLTGAIAKALIQAALIYLMSIYCSGTAKIMDRRFLLAALVITPFFQTFGANNDIGIIDASVTYSFFYGLASVWLLLFFLPFFQYYFHGRQLPSNKWLVFMMIPAGWIITFNGPLNAAVVLLVCPLVLLFIVVQWLRNPQDRILSSKVIFSNTPRILVWGLFAGLLFAVLSYYAGKYNVENSTQTMSLGDRYARLPKGIGDFFTTRPMLIIVGVVAFNLLWINRLRLPATKKINRLTLWFLLFSVVFIVLLPFGGYRAYRPYILRKDTMQPVLVGLFILYAITSLLLVGQLANARKLCYSLALVCVGLAFTKSDKLNRGTNTCERTALQTIALSPKNVVLIADSCNVMAWQRITDPAESRFNSALLFYWHVIPEVRYYYQK